MDVEFAVRGLRCHGARTQLRRATCRNGQVRPTELVSNISWWDVLSISAPSLRQQHYVINGFPPEWHERYLAREYFKWIRSCTTPRAVRCRAIWSDERFHNCESREFWEEAASLGLKTGMSFAVHGMPGMTGILSLARDQSLNLPAAREMAALIGRSQMFAGMLHDAVVRIDLPKLLPEQSIADDASRAGMSQVVGRWQDRMGRSARS